MQSPRHLFEVLVITLSIGLLPANALAFDYLEHSFFGDRACSEAQLLILDALKAEAEPSSELIARYLALGIICPTRWNTHYCSDDYKQLTSSLSLLEEPPSLGGGHSLTLGDLVALPDHLSQFGAVRGLGRATQRGLVDEVLRLLGPAAELPSGVITDVAEDACETDGLVDWLEVERDIGPASTRGEPNIAPALLTPGAWQAPVRGPSDPAGAYSFDNPHYLDLVLFNHHHFGEAAYDSWAGFHAAAVSLARSRCEDILDLEDDALEELAEGSPRFATIEWDELARPERNAMACQLLAERVAVRLEYWAEHADPTLVDPIRAHLPTQSATEKPTDITKKTLTALVSLVFEGAAIHFLQDNVAAGHLRVNRAAHDLGMSRYLHDEDGLHGVAAQVTSTRHQQHHILFGDSYLLGEQKASALASCKPSDPLAPDAVTACHIRRQRNLVLNQSAASLVHWVLGAPKRANLSCEQSPLREFVCSHLPIVPTAVSSRRELGLGTLPQPPPPFAFQSLSTSLSFDPAGGGSQTGIRLVFLSSLDEMANWMTSYHFGFLQTSRPYDGDYDGDETLTEFSYMFHWRWAARFLVNAGAYTYLGFQGLGHDVSLIWGLGPSIGMTLLPEGWSKIPLDISITYRMPITLLNSRYGVSSDAIQIDAHWIELAVGLAFM